MDPTDTFPEYQTDSVDHAENVPPAATKVRQAARRSHADPNAPKKPPTAFMAYSNDHRSSLLEKHPDQAKNVKAIASLLGQMWRDLSDEEKTRYKEDYARKKKEYDDTLREYYTANPDAKERDDAVKRVKKQAAAVKRSRGHGAGGGPKRPLTPFFCFVQKYRTIVKNENPTAKPTQITLRVAELWRSLDDEERKIYEEEAAKDRVRYNKECQEQGLEPSSVKRARRAALRDVAEAGARAAEQEDDDAEDEEAEGADEDEDEDAE